MLRSTTSQLALSSLFTGVAALTLSLLVGCGVGPVATGSSAAAIDQVGPSTMGGILHGGPNPIIGATITLYTTSNAGYGATANVVATTTTAGDGSFLLSLPTTSVACPSGQYAYLGSYAGNSGATFNNTATLLMAPIGLCDTYYSSSSSTTNNVTTYTNTYSGSTIWIDELSTAVSAYALGNFMSIGSGGVINIGAPANNFSTASSSTPSAAGLAHAFANALALVNNNTGIPNAYTNGGISLSTGGVVPDAEIYTLGNMLQACVNSNGPTGSNSATANDGSACGKLFSLTTPPQSGAAVPSNTLQAVVNLAKYPNPSINTWNSTCTASGGGSTTATTCLFNLGGSISSYSGGLTSAPPDWALAVVYTSGYGVQTTSCSSTCPGLVYPFFAALDYEDNVYVLNYSASTTTYTNIIGIQNNGKPIFSSAEDTTNTLIKTIGTDTNAHVFGTNSAASSTVKVYSAASGAVLATVTSGLGSTEGPSIADPAGNIYIGSSNTGGGVNVRKLTYSGTSSSPAYAAAAITTTAPSGAMQQIAFSPTLDLYMITATPTVYVLPNTGTFSSPTYAAAGILASTPALSGNTTNAYGVGATSAGNAFAITSAGITPITKTGSGSTTALATGTAVSLPTVVNSTLYNRALVVDGSNWAYAPDGANGSSVTGISVYDGPDGLALGTYKGCYVVSKACGTTAGSAPMYSPRGAVIDSSGDIWVVSGSSANLTELIGVAAPTWPGLSMAKFGQPQ